MAAGAFLTISPTVWRRHHGAAHNGTILVGCSVSRGLEFFKSEMPVLETTHVGLASGVDPELEAILSEEIPVRETPAEGTEEKP